MMLNLIPLQLVTSIIKLCIRTHVVLFTLMVLNYYNLCPFFLFRIVMAILVVLQWKGKYAVSVGLIK